MEKLIVSTVGKTYPIYIKSGLFITLPEIFKEKYYGKKIALVSDSNVYSLYGECLNAELTEAGFSVVPIVFKAGETQKNFTTLEYIYSVLADNYFTRSDMVSALGGGVTGDIAGLAAATFLRGMGFVQIPTTLLAMVDSSIGGKVAVDLPQGKNLVGAFYQPDAVYTDPKLLKTLTDSQFADGMAELLKHGFIRNINLYNILTDIKLQQLSVSSDSLSDVRAKLEPEMDHIIKESCKIKRDIVQLDEKDNGVRQLLNFGHTIGHAIEKVQNYNGLTHGQAISIGMVLITRLTEVMNLTITGEAKKIENALKIFKLPVSMPSIDIKALIEAIKIDKKARSDKITISYINKIGNGKLLEFDINDMEEKIYGLISNNTFTS
ncbi:MAG: 3-dehydroquinate synthase [Clostridiaceae bacterium]|nr:3-dehydroquinate synthase [Clostridiaceae bacterium]